MSTADRLRADIDMGRTGDKIPNSDPAAAPLGTDEEAAGTPLSPTAIAMARRAEVRAEAGTREDGGVLVYTLAVTAIGMLLVAVTALGLR
jgi:hypothetical protein